MLTIDIRHPDSLEFIKIKRDLTKVTGANISVRLNDEFMKAVENDRDYILRFPCNSNLSINKYDEWYPNWSDGNLNYIPKDDCYIKVVDAREYWNEIIKSAHGYAEPGVLFWDTMINYSPDGVYDKYRAISTNPCFTGDMRILTKEGYKTFEELEDKEVILIDGKGKEVLGKVWCSGEKEVIHLVMSRDGTRFCLDDDMCKEGEICVNGIPVNIETLNSTKSTLKCTPTHEFILYNGLVKTAQELSGQFLYPYKDEHHPIRVEKIEKGGVEKVYDFSLSGDMHWGVVEGVIAHNCSEIGMSNDSCRLMVTNLYSFVENPFTAEAHFNLDKFYKVNYEAQRLMDDLVDLELEYIDRIIDKVKSDPEPNHIKRIELTTLQALRLMGQYGRRTGLGFTGLGDMFAALGVGYGSEQSISIFEDIMQTKMASELDCTIDLSILRGAFEGWDSSKEFGEKMDSHSRPVYGRNEFYQMLIEDFREEANRMYKYGRRNVSWSTISPTGSVSLLTKTTSGIEPLFQPYYTRRKKINPSDGVSRVDFTDALGDKWQEYFVLHPKFKEWLYLQHKNLSIPRLGIISSELIPPEKWEKEILEEAFKYSPWYNSTANDIDWNMRVKMQSVAQRYISHSISSTVNIPSTASLEDVSNIYMEAWKMGSKGITVYRDSSRSGVLVSDTTQTNKDFKYYDAVKRPKKIEGEAFLTKVRGDDYTVFVGLIDNKPYEVFAYKGNGIVGKGSIIKKAKGHYMFVKDNDEFEITNNLTDEHEAITRGYSFGLRHGGAIEFAVEQLNKTKGTLVDFNKALARVLKKFIPNESTVSDKTCPSCGEDSLVYEEGCLICRSCGYGKC